MHAPGYSTRAPVASQELDKTKLRDIAAEITAIDESVSALQSLASGN